MKCEACHKSEATVAYTHIDDDHKKTLYLCGACVAAKKLVEPLAAKAVEVPVLVKKVKVELKHLERSEAPGGIECPQCGMTYEQFKKVGRLGCHACYEAFEEQMVRLLKRIHGALEHRGKGPIAAGDTPPPEEELEKLRRELGQAVSEEAFERAAELRDRIRALEAEFGEEGAEPGRS